ncbi:permease [Tepiditoga spiralis]|uniref:Permease n=1 Tax=Tepiditoga spiralis TaxID=2108365 RepID=A0A7G1G9Q0_9BACT|nr:NCS2 family permease [Tepiditoga spiralis]BBE30802.1 permease [Tepiditoga spiralis]
MDKFFKITESGSTIKKEIYGGILSFLMMAYIIIVNPAILVNAIPGAMGNVNIYNQFFGAIMVATILGGSIASIIMGLFSNYPFVLAPGMGLNAYFTYTVVLKLGMDWQMALGAVFIAGFIFMIVIITGVREIISKALPDSIKYAIVGGIGIFIAFLGLKNSGIIVSNQDTLIALGNIKNDEVLTSIFGLFLISILYVLKVPGSILIGIIGATIFGLFNGVTNFKGIIGPIPSLSPTFLKLKLEPSIFKNADFWIVVITFFFVDYFDTTGTIFGLARSKHTDETKDVPRASRAYMADATGSVIGALFGTSTITTVAESDAGILYGARTGLASIVAGGMMLLMLFFAPLATSIPTAATAPALIFIGSLMLKEIGKIKWNDSTEGLPAFLTIILMPLTYSIAMGLAFGIITYPILKLFSGKSKEVHWMSWILCFIFIVYLGFLK